MTNPGRPRGELSDEQRVQLLQLVERIASLRSEVGQLEVELAQQAATAAEGGASYRAIAEALGMSKSAVERLVASTATS